MARIVMGIGSSHSPQLSTHSDGWLQRGQNDKRHKQLVGLDGQVTDFEGLMEKADVDRISKEITPEKMLDRHERNQNAIAHLSKTLYDSNLDILVMLGDDQQEYLLDDNMPGICVFWGDEVKVNGNQALIGYSAEDRTVPTHSALGLHLIDYLVESEFDIACSNALDPNKGGHEMGGIGHAFGYVYHRIMTEKVIPVVPIMVNTYYPPNQPTPKRCYDLGRAIRSAIEAWPTDARVGVLASGGLSHFVVDEGLDEMALDGMKDRSVAKLGALPREKMHSGNSEIRNWISVTGATEHLKMDLVDYVPSYRSPAGTGCAMGFATWS